LTWLAWIALAVLLIGVVLVLLPLRLHLSLQGRGDPSGSWMLAGGGQLGPLALSGLGAQGVTPTAQLHLFGKQIWQRPLLELLKTKEEEPEQERGAVKSVRGGYARLSRWFDPLDLALFIVRERRRVWVELLEVDLEYSFEDVALTGKVLGAVYMVSGVLPPPIVIRQTPSWESLDQAQVALVGKIRIRPGLFVLDSAIYVVTNLRIRRRKPPARGATEST
jgi:hypothetical protein